MTSEPPTPIRRDSFVSGTGPRHPLAKACDQCHRCKIACDGGRPVCSRCERTGNICTYSLGKPVGKPPGSKARARADCKVTTRRRLTEQDKNLPPQKRQRVETATDRFSAPANASTVIEPSRELAQIEDKTAPVAPKSFSFNLEDLPDEMLPETGVACSPHPPGRYDFPALHGGDNAFGGSPFTFHLGELNFNTPEDNYASASNFRKDIAAQVITEHLPGHLTPIPCLCVNNPYGIIGSLSRPSKGDALGSIKHAKTIQSDIRKSLRCHEHNTPSPFALITFAVLLLHLASELSIVHDLSDHDMAEGALAVVIEGMELFIREADIKEKILAAAVADQVQAALQLSEEITKAAVGLQSEGEVVRLLMALTKEKLKSV